jgi:hypothetical protein
MSHNADAAAVFWAEFQSSRRDIEALINVGSSSTNFDAIRDRITRLQGTLTASAIFLPAYRNTRCTVFFHGDQRQPRPYLEHVGGSRRIDLDTEQ